MRRVELAVRGNGRPESLPVFSSQPTSLHAGRPSSTVSAEDEIQTALQRGNAMLAQLVQLTSRLAENDHSKIFQIHVPSALSPRQKSTCGLGFHEAPAGHCVVDTVVTGGPAFNSREFAQGDVIVAIDGVPVDNNNIHALMRGCDVVGSMVEVRLARDGDPNQIKQVKLARADSEMFAVRMEIMQLCSRLKVEVSS